MNFPKLPLFPHASLFSGFSPFCCKPLGKKTHTLPERQLGFRKRRARGRRWQCRGKTSVGEWGSVGMGDGGTAAGSLQTPPSPYWSQVNTCIQVGLRLTKEKHGWLKCTAANSKSRGLHRDVRLGHESPGSEALVWHKVAVVYLPCQRLSLYCCDTQWVNRSVVSIMTG